MADSLVICEVDPDLKKELRNFRFRKEKNNAAIIMKVDKENQSIVVDDKLEDISIDELRDELPERQPRYVVYSCKICHDDGRTSYPMIFIFSTPMGCKTDQQLMYAGSKTNVVNELQLTKVYEVRSTDELTEEWLEEKLKRF